MELTLTEKEIAYNQALATPNQIDSLLNACLEVRMGIHRKVLKKALKDKNRNIEEEIASHVAEACKIEEDIKNGVPIKRDFAARAIRRLYGYNKIK